MTGRYTKKPILRNAGDGIVVYENILPMMCFISYVPCIQMGDPPMATAVSQMYRYTFSNYFHCSCGSQIHWLIFLPPHLGILAQLKSRSSTTFTQRNNTTNYNITSSSRPHLYSQDVSRSDQTSLWLRRHAQRTCYLRQLCQHHLQRKLSTKDKAAWLGTHKCSSHRLSTLSMLQPPGSSWALRLYD